VNPEVVARFVEKHQASSNLERQHVYPCEGAEYGACGGEPHTRDCPAYPHSQRLAEQLLELIEYGTIVPGVTCPACGGELVAASNGAFCEECLSYVPIVGNAVVLDEADEALSCDECYDIAHDELDAREACESHRLER
jgi:hypothetical protein